jgi:hypothetical protein
MRIAAVLLVTLVTSFAPTVTAAQETPPVIAAAQATTQASTTLLGSLDGAPYRIVVPENWGGSLLVYVHGYNESADPPMVAPPNISEAALRVAAMGDFNMTDRYKLIPAASYQYSYYHAGNIGGDAIDETRNMSVNMLRLTALLSYQLDDEWTIYGGPSGAFAAQAGAEIGDSLTGGVLGGFNYHWSDTLSVGAGLGIFSRLGEKASVLPFVTADWAFADQWDVRVGFQEVAGNGGYGGEVTYDFLNNFKLGGGIQVEQKRWRLKDRGDRDGGVAQDRNVPLYAKLTWEPHQEFALEAIAGVAVGGQLRVQDASGHHWRSNDYDPSGLFGLRAVWKF